MIASCLMNLSIITLGGAVVRPDDVHSFGSSPRLSSCWSSVTPESTIRGRHFPFQTFSTGLLKRAGVSRSRFNICNTPTVRARSNAIEAEYAFALGLVNYCLLESVENSVEESGVEQDRKGSSHPNPDRFSNVT